MAPKKVKELVPDENYWRTCIETTQLNDDNFKIRVILIEAAGSDQDRIYLNKFEISAAQEKRSVIKNICKTETIFMVNQLGGDKKVKDENLRVFEEGQSYLKEKKDIPPDILALIIKHLILKMKEEYIYIKRQRLEVREGMKKESATMIDRTEVRGTINVQPPEPQELTETSPKSKTKRGEPVPTETEFPESIEGKKYNTLLRVRGEEWRDKIYVDDYPKDGPNLYIAVTGFQEPYLAICLVKIGIPLTAIVQIRIDQDNSKIPSSLLRASKRGQSQTDNLIDKSQKFWKDIQQLRIQRDTTDDFKHTAFVVFSPPYWDTEMLSGNPDKIYDELCYLMYDIQDLKRQHLHFIDNMNIIRVPEDKEDSCYMKSYNLQLDDLPLECVTVYSVLDSMLRTVSRSHKLKKKYSQPTISNTQQNLNEQTKVEKAETLVTEIFNKLCPDNIKKYRITYGEEYEDFKNPIVINYGDKAKYSTFHLGNINLDNIIWSSLFGTPIYRLWQNFDAPTGEIEAKINFHVNLLLSCFEREDIETAELNRLLHILSCRKLYNNRSSLRNVLLPLSTLTEFKKLYLKRSVLAKPLSKESTSLLQISSSNSHSFPSITKSENTLDQSYEEDPEISRVKFLFDCPDISELISVAEIDSGKPISNIIEDYDFFEDFTGISALQIILDAYNNFNCVDYKYCTVTDSIILLFYNSHDKDGLTRQNWRCHLPTPLCLQDFFDFVLEEHFDWIQNEEELYDERLLLKYQSESKVWIDPSATKLCVEQTDMESELLMEGSLKFGELIAQLEEVTSEVKDIDSSSKKTTISLSQTDVDSKSSKKPKSPAASTPKNVRKSFTNTNISETQNVVIKPFSGYDLGDRRIEAFGKDSMFYSEEGTKITSKYTLIIPMNLEYIVLNVVPGNNNNSFWVHRAIGEFVPTEILRMCESFRVTTADQVIINIKKQTYQIPILIASVAENLRDKEYLSKTRSEKFTSPQIYEIKYFHSFYITWPNGLITESVHVENSPEVSHIKQCYVKPLAHLNEDMRCISLNGEVIIFRPTGLIEVFRPDGSYIKVISCKKTMFRSDTAEDVASELNSDKGKKSKGKEKDKSSKGTSSVQTSKNAESEDENVIKPLKYELIIDDFEVTETSGLRKKYINENVNIIEKLLIRTATNYNLGEFFSRRMDGVNTLLNKDGVQIVTFADSTRIITSFIIDENEIYPEWTEEEKEYFETFELDVLENNTLKSQRSYENTDSDHNINANSTITGKGEEIKSQEEERRDGYISVNIIYTIEHPNFTTVSINKSSGNITVDSINNTSLVVDTNNQYDLLMDCATTAHFDGEKLHIDYDACSECKSKTTCDIKITSDDLCSVTKFQQNFLIMKDSFGKEVIVNEEGGISLIETDHSIELVFEENQLNEPILETLSGTFENDLDKSPNEARLHNTKCSTAYVENTLRFIVLRRDLTCSELVHKALVEMYKRVNCWQPWCSIDSHDTFGDYRSLVSILTPIHHTETENHQYRANVVFDGPSQSQTEHSILQLYSEWYNVEYPMISAALCANSDGPFAVLNDLDSAVLNRIIIFTKWQMDSKLAGKPKHLQYKDLKKDCCKGFYYWMRPYERFEPKPTKPANVLPPRLPRAFVLRTLEQQWNDSKKEELQGAKELLMAILKYRQIIENDTESILNVSISDPRSEDERRIDDIVQAIAHRTYEDLRARLADDIHARAKATITTKPLPVPEMSVEEETEHEESLSTKMSEQEHESILKEIDEAAQMSPNLRRYWRRREEEYNEEQFYLHLLREGTVPPYFKNLLGGAIWWEMNAAAGEAVTKTERRKMKCVCNEDVKSSDNGERN